MRFILLFGALLLFVVSTRPVQADWEGSITTDASGSQMSGQIHMKKDLIRADFKTPTALSVIMNLTTAKAWVLLHMPHLALANDFSRYKNQVPMCSAADVDGCLKQHGFTQKGKETYEGHLCIVYEGHLDRKNPKTLTKLWRPTDLKEVPSLKTLVRTVDNKGSSTYIRDVKVGAQDAKLFAVPADYREIQGMGK
ncbi:MAG: hypothetical protein H7222_15715 [Methylotenera sp.]|nr:hypothetical protein [Oligoflexia bacterium]